MRRKHVIGGVPILGMAIMVLFACHAPKIRSVIINSEPQGAQVLLDAEVIGQTPLKRDIKFKNVKKERHTIQIRKDGYQTQERYFYYRDQENILFQLEKQQ